MLPIHHGLCVLLGSIFLLCYCPLALANAPQRAWTTYTTRHGLAANTIFCISLDGETIWIGTTQGITRFAGSRMTTYSHVHGLGDDWVVDIVPDGKGGIWVGTYGGGVSHFDGQGWTTYNQSNSGLSNDFVTDLDLTPDGTLWVATHGGGVSRRSSNGRWTRYNAGALGGNYVDALVAGSDSTVWIAIQGEGIRRFDGQRWTPIYTAEGLEHNRVNNILVTANGDVWLATEEGVSCLQANDLHREHHYGVSDGLPHPQVNTLALGPEGIIWAATAGGMAYLEGAGWVTEGLPTGYCSAVAIAMNGEIWVGTLSDGLRVYTGHPLPAQELLPVILVHGWHGPESDRLEDSEFRFLASWLERDGFPVYYARGISPLNTMLENAASLAQTIQQAKKETGSDQVNIIGFSMGGLNARAYIESSLYRNDVAAVYTMGTPHAGVRQWYPFVLRQALEWTDEPSIYELLPEHVLLWNATHCNTYKVPYILVAGEARGDPLPSIFEYITPGDGLVSAWSAHALDGPSTTHITTPDVHAWSAETILTGVRSYLEPSDTYDHYLREALRYGPPSPSPAPMRAEPPKAVHTPFISGEVRGGQSVSCTVPIDAASAAQFYLRGYSGEWSLSLIDPNGRAIDAQWAQETDAVQFLSYSPASFVACLIKQPEPGKWTVNISRKDTGSTPVGFAFYVALDSPLTLDVAIAPQWCRKSTPVLISATLCDRGVSVSGAQVWAEIGRPNRERIRLQLFDDGAHGDGEANDGLYANTFDETTLGGYYLVFVTAEGTRSGLGYARGQEITFTVSPETATMTGVFEVRVEDEDGDGLWNALIVNVGLDVTKAGKFLLWGLLTDPEGNEVCGVNQIVDLNAGKQSVSLPFPGSLIRASGRDGPYHLAEVILLDASSAAVALDSAYGIVNIGPYSCIAFE